MDEETQGRLAVLGRAGLLSHGLAVPLTRNGPSPAR